MCVCVCAISVYVYKARLGQISCKLKKNQIGQQHSVTEMEIFSFCATGKEHNRHNYRVGVPVCVCVWGGFSSVQRSFGDDSFLHVGEALSLALTVKYLTFPHGRWGRNKNKCECLPPLYCVTFHAPAKPFKKSALTAKIMKIALNS